MNAARIIASRLAAAGVREVFGIPGGEVLALVRAIDEAGIRFVLCKHENAGGFMAEGAWRGGGAPGVLLATLGPGVANAVNVVANAWQDRVPLVFVTGCIDAAETHTYTHQVIDHGLLLRSVTKATLTVADGVADVVIDKALSIALEDPPGPVHVDLPISLATREQPRARPTGALLPQRAGPLPGPALEQARGWLEQAHQPLLIVGMEVLFQGGAKAVADFARRLQMPVLTTYKAKGVLDEADSLCLGGAGLSPKADAILLPLVAMSDFIVLAGYDPIEMRSNWRDPWPGDARVVEFRAASNPHGMHRASITFSGDIAAGLAALADGVSPAACWPGREIADARGRLARLFAADGEDWGARAVIEVARSELPTDAVATVDSGAHRILLSQMWTCREPETLLQSTGFCTMGCALPLAIGYKRARPERPVAAFIGDAGLEMVLGELATLRDCALPIIVIVFVDQSLALIERKQRGAGYRNVGVDFPGTNFAAVAEAMGGRGVDVGCREELAAAIRQALGEERRFTLIACRIGRRAYDELF